MTNPLQELLKKQQERKVKEPSKRDYFEQNLDMILQLVAADTLRDDIIKAIERDGVKMSKRYFAKLLEEVRQHGCLLPRSRTQIPK